MQPPNSRTSLNAPLIATPSSLVAPGTNAPLLCAGTPSQPKLTKRLLLLIPALLTAGAASAVEIATGDDWRLAVDSTLSYGQSWRVQGPDENNMGKVAVNPGVGLLDNAAQRLAPGRWGVNSDDANLLYGSGDVFSNALKLTSEASLQMAHGGAFVRASWFRDDAVLAQDHLSEQARDKAGQDFRLLDAFVYADFELDGHDASVRIGSQVVNWGESTFLQGGINAINPIDLTKLRVAGAELKEVLLPVNLVAASFEISDKLSVDALYMLEFEQIELDPVGTYFSNSDFGGAGGRYVMAGFGIAPQPVINPDLLESVCSGAVASDNPAVAASPVLRATGCGSALRRREDRYAQDGGQFGFALHYFVPELENTEFGLYYLNYHSRLPLISGTSLTTSAVNSASVYLEYPEDIHLFGGSFNTGIASLGIALQGEVAHRSNQPLQIDDVEVLYHALSPLNAIIPQPYNRFISQLGNVPPGTDIRGYERHSLSQWQVTATRVFGQIFGAEQLVWVTEFGGTKVWDLPDPSVLRYQGEGTDTGGGPDVNSGSGRNPVTQVIGFPTPYSWGYRTLLRADYANPFNWPVSVSPRFAFNHDVNGISPGPGGNFMEGRRSLSLGAEFNYLNRWTLDIGYTRFSGAQLTNTLHDRDFASVSIRWAL